MKHQLDNHWKEWIYHNLNQGGDKDGIVKELLDNDFHPQTIINELQYHPVSIKLLAEIKQKMASQLFIPVPSQQPIIIDFEDIDTAPSHDENSISVVSTSSASVTSVANGSAQDKDTENTASNNNVKNIDCVLLPHASKLDSDKVHMYLVDDFLTHEVCDEIISRIKKQCRPSTITTDDPDKEFRTSKTCDLCNHPDDFINDLDRQIADYLGMEVERSEGIQGQYYQVGDQFKTHSDFFEPNTKEYNECAGELGQRTWTFMIYLNDVPEGGQTEFTELGVAFTPKKGQAVVWNSLYSTGEVNRDTMHWAKPIIEGEKYVITKWFRTYGTLKNDFIPYLHKQVPVFTKKGFARTILNKKLFNKISAFYHDNKENAPVENDAAIGTFIHVKDSTSLSKSTNGKQKIPSKIVELSTELKADIFKTIHPLLEEWSGQTLEHSAIYGIREYQHDAILDMHVDRYQTHIISMIINVDQEVNSEWPLYIYDHHSRLHKVFLKPGDVVFYESARVAHGRPEALDGKTYANIFAHTMPAGWGKKAELMTKQLETGEARQKMSFSG